MNKKKVLILVNHDVVIYNFRKELVKKLIEEDYDVYLSLPYGEKVDLLVEMGCKFIETPIDRRDTNPFKDLLLIKKYFQIMKKIKPDIILSYTIKPNIYGAIISRILGIPIIANVTGLGSAINSRGFLRKIITNLYKFSFRSIDCVFFQNENDSNFFLSNNIKMKKHVLIPGSGVNLSEFTYEDYPAESKVETFLFVGRIMRDKGIEELIEAASNIKQSNPDVEFHAIGFAEEEYKEKIKTLQEDSIIKFHGMQSNVRDYLIECNAIVHPTYHEGMSNVLLEAAATGRPILASNIPGCKEIFDEDLSGIGFQPQNAESLALSIQKFLNLTYEEKKEMGLMGRKKVEKEFNRSIVVKKYMDEIEKLTKEENGYELV